MADAQGIPVFIRGVIEEHGRFIGRFAPTEIPALVDLVKEWGYYDGDNMLLDPMGQFVGYENSRRVDYVGFEIVVDRA